MTPEAKFAYQCDKLEADLQCCLYDRDGCVDLSIQNGNPAMQDQKVQRLYQQGLSWSQIWCSIERNRIGYDDNFMNILLSASGLDNEPEKLPDEK